MTNSKTSRRATVLAPTILLAGLTLLPGPTAWAQAGDPPDTTKLVSGSSSSGFGALSLYIALEQGRFQKAGVNVERQDLNGGTPAVMAAFATGGVTLLNLSAPELIQYAGNKVIAGKAFAEMTDKNNDIVVANSIKSFADLKGKSVAISSPNGSDYFFFVATMEKYGLSPKDVTFIASGNPVNRMAALTAGSVQATAVPYFQRDAATKADRILVKAGDNPVEFPTVLFIAGDDLLAHHKPLLKRFLTVVNEATAWMRANPADAAKICAKVFNATVESCLSQITIGFDPAISSRFTWSPTAALNVEGLRSALALMASLDPKTKGLTLDDIADTSIAGTTP